MNVSQIIRPKLPSLDSHVLAYNDPEDHVDSLNQASWLQVQHASSAGARGYTYIENAEVHNILFAHRSISSNSIQVMILESASTNVVELLAGARKPVCIIIRAHGSLTGLIGAI